jgi:hypothetical protein
MSNHFSMTYPEVMWQSEKEEKGKKKKNKETHPVLGKPTQLLDQAGLHHHKRVPSCLTF